MSEPIHEYRCDECPHVFSPDDIQAEEDDVRWGHSCFGDFKGNKRKPGTFHCESYRQHVVVLTIEDYSKLVRP